MKIKTNFIIPILLLLSISISSQEKMNVDEFRNEGYFNITKFSYIFVNSARLETFSPTNGVVNTGLPTDNSTSFSLQTINGYFFGPYFSGGIGIGLDRYNNPNFNTLPIFLDFRSYLSDDKTSPYIYLDYGTLVKVENGINNGSMFNIGVGYKLPINKKRLILVTDLGYSYKSISNDGLPVRKSESWVQVKGLVLSLGIIF